MSQDVQVTTMPWLVLRWYFYIACYFLVYAATASKQCSKWDGIAYWNFRGCLETYYHFFSQIVTKQNT